MSGPSTSPPAKTDGITAFTSLFIRRPVLTIVINLLIIVAGLAALQSIEVRELPDVDRPVISVRTELEGASPEVIDRQVTEIIEGAIARVSGIDSVSSESEFGSSRVTIEFTETTDLNVAASDVRDAVGRVVNQLPEDAEEARITKADANGDAIMRVAVTAPGMPIEELTDLVEDRIVDQIAAVEGVADVQVYGDRERLIFIDVNPDKLATRGFTLSDVSAALSNAAFDVPAGRLDSATQDLIVRADASVSTPAEFEAIALDARTRLGDVANVRFGPADAASTLRVNGATGVGMGVLAQAGSSTLEISAGVRATVAQLNTSLPDGVRLEVTSDDADFIDGSIHEVIIALVVAVVIVTIVIYLFLMNFRATFIPTVTIPIALVGVLSLIYLAGFSINILTLLALVLATGLVVDDAIIVLENIIRRRDMGAKPRAAAVIGTREVFFAVISTTATLAAVFVPISFLPGRAGGLFREFGFVLALAVVISSFIALTLCPMLAANLLKDRDHTSKPGFLKRTLGGVGNRLAAVYGFLLRGCLSFPLPTVVGAALIAAVAYFGFLTLPQELTPSEDRGSVLLSISAPQGVGLDYTDGKVRQIESIVMPYVESGEATSIFAIAGRGTANSAFMVVSLAPWGERERTQQEIAAEINAQIAGITGVRAVAIQPNSLGIRGGGRGLQFAVAGSSYEQITQEALALAEAMDRDGRWGRVRLTNDASQPQLSINIDRQRASDLGIDIDGLAVAMQALLDGREIGQTYVDDVSVPIRIVSTSNPVNDPGDLRNIFLKTGDGRIVPVSTIATTEERAIAPALEREDQARTISVTAEIPPDYAIQSAWSDTQAFAEDILSEDVRLLPLAEAATLDETTGGLVLVFGFAIVIVILVLAAQFESFVSAFIIIATVPFGLACAVFALMFFGESLNLYSQIGLVLLVGIMAKNGILIVEFANELRNEGQSVREAVENAAMIRLRPVMMTMIATIVGGVPLLLATGAGAEARVSLGYVIVGGLGLSTAATLFLTPVAYLALARFAKPQGEQQSRLSRELAEAERFIGEEERAEEAKAGGKADGTAPQPA